MDFTFSHTVTDDPRVFNVVVTRTNGVTSSHICATRNGLSDLEAMIGEILNPPAPPEE